MRNLGHQRELFLDGQELERSEAALRLHEPVDRGVCFRFDAPWEGWGCGYMYVVRDAGIYRMYYVTGGLKDATGTKLEAGHADRRVACVIESEDGIRWTRPELSFFTAPSGETVNNIVWDKYAAFGYTDPDKFLHSTDYLDNFSVFLDTAPGCPADERWKATDGAWQNLHLYGSADGLKWRLLNGGKPAELAGTFDSGNVPLRDEGRGCYQLYYRDFHDVPGDDFNAGIRDIRHAVSDDFIHWEAKGMLDFGGAADVPLYTSAICQYPLAPQYFIGFPVRYVERQEWSPSFDQLPNLQHRKNRMAWSRRHGLAVTDCLFMSSRDGHRFTRSETAFLRPGVCADTNWVYGDCYFSTGLTQTPALRPEAPDELSLYAMDNHFQNEKALRRYTLRADGFVSLCFGGQPQTAITTPFTFVGSRLALNLSTAATTNGFVELLDADGAPIDGFTAADCDPIFGDRLDYVVSWNGSPDVSKLAGKPIKLRFGFADADLYAYQFID